jgi:hypothetical protein
LVGVSLSGERFAVRGVAFFADSDFPLVRAALANGRHVFAPFLGAVEQIWSKKSIWLAWKREKDSSITPESLSF